MSLSDEIRYGSYKVPLGNQNTHVIPADKVEKFVNEIIDEILKEIPRNWKPTLRMLNKIRELAGDKLLSIDAKCVEGEQ